MRRSRRSRRRSRRATGGAGRRSWRGTTRRWTRRWPGCTRCEVPPAGELPRRGAARRIDTSADPVFLGAPRVRADGHGGDAGGPRRRAAGERAARRRHLPAGHLQVREAEHLRPGRRVGPGHVHPVRQLLVRLPAQRHQVHVLPRRPARRGAGRVQVRAARLARPAGQQLHACRSTPRTAPGAGCAWRPARCRCAAAPRPDPARRADGGARPREPGRRRRARRSTWSPTTRTRCGGTWRSSRRCRSPTGPGWTSARCAARSSSSRCSSSPARAPAAARRRTCGCFPSCSATG